MKSRSKHVLQIVSAILKRLRLSREYQDESYRFWSELLEYKPRDIELINLAMSHRSAASHSHDARLTNERLEFLGDAMIGLVVADSLYRTFPTETEGFLTRARARVVCREALNHVAHKLLLDRHLKLGIALKDNAENVYGNALEALVGAIYLDGGFYRAAQFVRKHIVVSEQHLRELAQHDIDYKSQLLEWAQAGHKRVEFVQLADQYDVRNDVHLFECEVLINSNAVAKAKGSTKKLAQQNAAKKSLEVVKMNKNG